MILWRVSSFAALDGEGGLRSPGRWHHAGKRIIYTAESVALALLEALVQFDLESRMPSRYQLLKIEVPDEADSALFEGSAPERAASQTWGDRWLVERSSLLARVPAVVAPHSFNWLINPAHPAASAVRLVETQQWNWDDRLAR